MPKIVKYTYFCCFMLKSIKLYNFPLFSCNEDYKRENIHVGYFCPDGIVKYDGFSASDWYHNK
jgi:hypothetical protein